MGATGWAPASAQETPTVTRWDTGLALEPQGAALLRDNGTEMWIRDVATSPEG